MQDLRDAVRSLRSTPVVSLMAILSLALGIGANTAIFSILDSLFLRTLPVRDPHQLVVRGVSVLDVAEIPELFAGTGEADNERIASQARPSPAARFCGVKSAVTTG